MKSFVVNCFHVCNDEFENVTCSHVHYDLDCGASISSNMVKC